MCLSVIKHGEQKQYVYKIRMFCDTTKETNTKKWQTSAACKTNYKIKITKMQKRTTNLVERNKKIIFILTTNVYNIQLETN